MKKITSVALLAVAGLFLPAERGSAIPGYARKHGFNCNMCHTAYPKLNDFGQRFRDDGYQVAGQEGKEATVFATPPPIAMRTTTGLSVYDSKEGSTAGFNLFGLDLLASGVLHKNVSFLLIYTPRIDEPAADHTGEGPAQNGALESAALVFSNIIPNALNLRVGRFEPGTHAFSSKRSYFMFAPYEMYGFTTPASANPFSFDDNQIGAEATGHFRNGFKYGLGFVNGTGANPDNNRNKDVYANLFKTFGRGDGQSAGQRIGVFGYYGWQPAKEGTLISPTGEGNGADNKAFYRFGADGSLNWRTWNLELMWMKGLDDKAFHVSDPAKNYEYSGFFAELDWAALMNNRLVASILYNQVSPPESDAERQISAVSGLVRYYLGDWSAVNVSIHAEATHRTHGKDVKVSENLFALLLDFAF